MKTKTKTKTRNLLHWIGLSVASQENKLSSKTISQIEKKENQDREPTKLDAVGPFWALPVAPRNETKPGN